MQTDKIFKEIAACTLSAIMTFGCVAQPGSVEPTQTAIYHHATWVKDSKTYLDVWTRGVEIVSQPWYGDPYVSFYLGSNWESFRYDPDYDHIDSIPEPGYNGPDKLVYGKTGEVVSY
jgi:hypothetical protein